MNHDIFDRGVLGDGPIFLVLDVSFFSAFDFTLLAKFLALAGAFFAAAFALLAVALTNHSHPCQVIADLVTLKEKFGDFKNKKVSWFGDFNNVTQSWIEAAAILDINFSIASPSGVLASKNTIKWLEKQNKNIII